MSPVSDTKEKSPSKRRACVYTRACVCSCAFNHHKTSSVCTYIYIEVRHACVSHLPCALTCVSARNASGIRIRIYIYVHAYARTRVYAYMYIFSLSRDTSNIDLRRARRGHIYLGGNWSPTRRRLVLFFVLPDDDDDDDGRKVPRSLPDIYIWLSSFCAVLWLFTLASSCCLYWFSCCGSSLVCMSFWLWWRYIVSVSLRSSY